MGHEMGHYVLHHVYEIDPLSSRWCCWPASRSCAGPSTGPRRAGASAGGQRHRRSRRPAAPGGAVLVYFFVLTPVNNTFIRTNEAEADIFGLNAAREPDGFAEAALQLGEYRKLHPGPDRGVDLLRPSERLQPHPDGDELEEGERGAVSTSSFLVHHDLSPPLQDSSTDRLSCPIDGAVPGSGPHKWEARPSWDRRNACDALPRSLSGERR